LLHQTKPPGKEMVYDQSWSPKVPSPGR